MNDEKKAEIEQLLKESGWHAEDKLVQPLTQDHDPDTSKLDLILAELKDMNRSLKRLAWRRN